ncbi:hypothetical protein [Paucilactobacillus oligofermentans]|uniref:hypothetical protein n=1 Tax=Paucilactobacillus oligofermentans TaxID=293371 RepID=UPI000F504647|nr:hypothetical protein [Paucilactobacillus oligofermentans]
MTVIIITCGIALFIQAYHDKRLRGQKNYRPWNEFFRGKNKFSETESNNETTQSNKLQIPNELAPISGSIGIVLPSIFLTTNYQKLNDDETDDFLDEAMSDLNRQGLNTSEWTYDQSTIVFNALMKYDEIDPELLQDPNEFDALEDDIEIQRREIDHDDYPGDEDDKDFDLAGKSIDGTNYDNWNHPDAEDYDADEYTKYYSNH